MDEYYLRSHSDPEADWEKYFVPVSCFLLYMTIVYNFLYMTMLI